MLLATIDFWIFFFVLFFFVSNEAPRKCQILNVEVKTTMDDEKKAKFHMGHTFESDGKKARSIHQTHAPSTTSSSSSSSSSVSTTATHVYWWS